MKIKEEIIFKNIKLVRIDTNSAKKINKKLWIVFIKIGNIVFSSNPIKYSNIVDNVTAIKHRFDLVEKGHKYFIPKDYLHVDR